jgi:hypothetical protein
MIPLWRELIEMIFGPVVKSDAIRRLEVPVAI